MQRKSSSSQLTLLFATCRTYDEPVFIFITPRKKGRHHGCVSPDRERDIQGSRITLRVAGLIPPLLANSQFQTLVIGTDVRGIQWVSLSGPSVTLQWLSTETAARRSALEKATLLYKGKGYLMQLRSAGGGCMERGESCYACLLTASPSGYFYSNPLQLSLVPNGSLPPRRVSQMRGSDTAAGEPCHRQR